MSEQNQRAEELFDKLSKDKKKRRRRILRTVLMIIGILAVILILAVVNLRRRVEERFASAAAEVETYNVTTGTIHTVVAGSGSLAAVDLEQITLPAGVEITEVTAEAGDMVAKGDLLATVDMATVMTTLSSLQEQLDDLDDEINDAKGDTISATISAGIAGRVKRIFAEPGMDVGACMAKNGALALISLDGHMAVELETDKLSKGDTVTVLREDGVTAISGTVDSCLGGTAVILVTDNGPRMDEEVTIIAADGTELGMGTLYIHSPLSVTGYAGTIKKVSVAENASVNARTTVVTLKDTNFSANYDTLLRDRTELEEELLQLLTVYRDGAVLAQMDGMVSSVEYISEEEYTQDENGNTNLLNLYPNISMSVTISIDEMDILSLKEGQKADVVVSSVSEETVYSGTVTEISKVADTSSGVTLYAAEVTLDRAEGMLPGMTADVDVKIEGVENAILIPVDALRQTSATHYVYTTYDEELRQYGGMVEVTIGMQNDNYVEILSGLNVGDTVCYVKSQNNFFGFMNMPNMGSSNRNGGGRPSGGFNRNGGGMPSGAPNRR